MGQSPSRSKPPDSRVADSGTNRYGSSNATARRRRPDLDDLERLCGAAQRHAPTDRCAVLGRRALTASRRDRHSGARSRAHNVSTSDSPYLCAELGQLQAVRTVINAVDELVWVSTEADAHSDVGGAPGPRASAPASVLSMHLDPRPAGGPGPPRRQATRVPYRPATGRRHRTPQQRFDVGYSGTSGTSCAGFRLISSLSSLPGLK